MLRGYADMHCDTLFQCIRLGKETLNALPEAALDIRRLREGNALLQCFAVYFPPMLAEGYLEDLPLFSGEISYFEAARNVLMRTVKEEPEEIALVTDGESLRRARREGRTGAVLTVEDGRIADGRLEGLDYLYRQGVRLITLTWNGMNCFGCPNSENPAVMQQGLTDFGKEAVRYMNELGILIDISHLSDGGAWDVARLSEKPFVASHSNCRVLCPHPRNLPDELIRTVAQKGGVIGLNFSPTFLSQDGKADEKGRSRVEDMVRHVLHLLQTGGEDCVGIGTDYDGIHGFCEIEAPREMEKLFLALARAGVHERQIDKFAFENVFRIFGEL